ncbi:MAG: OmpA family protein [Myxococcota bacterium]
MRTGKRTGRGTALHGIVAAALCAGLVGVASGEARAATDLNASAFQPSSLPGDLLSVGTSRTAAPMSLTTGLDLHFADAPMGFEGTDPVRDATFTEETVGSRTMAELLVGFTPISRLQVGLALPFVLTGDGAGRRYSGAPDTSGFHVGEARLDLKGVLFRDDIFGLAVGAYGTFPTATQDSLAGNGLGGGARIITDLTLGRVLLALNLGAYLRGEDATFQPDGLADPILEVGHEWTAGLGGEVRVVDGVSVVAETYLRTALDEPFADDGTTQLEGLGGVRWRPIESVAVTAGAGGGTPLYEGYGTSRFRVFAGARWTWTAPGDRDGDGIPDGEDECPLWPEDMDGFEDRDGCPDPDNDGDEILDGEDACPNDPEDMDGFEDGDGCPDPDNDGDGIPDVDDECPNEPEDMDGFEDGDGCPDPDNDGDGIPDVDDECPNEPETVNGYEDDDGCPDYPGVKVEGERILLDTPVVFDRRSHEPESSSYEVLRNLARLMNANPGWATVRIEVHAGGRWRPERWMEVTRERARALRQFLVVEGVAPHRLEIVPKGVTEPVADNETREGRAQNDRVEITIRRE